jgi:hypothetical protein
MVKPKERVTRACKLIRHDTTNTKVSRGMNSVESFKSNVKALNSVTRVDEVNHFGRLGVAAPLNRDIAVETAWVVSQTTIWTRLEKGNGAEVHGGIGKGARVDASTAGAGTEQGRKAEPRVVDVAMRDGLAIAAHRGGGPVKYGRRGKVLPVEGPVPIGLVAGIAALFT